MNGLNWIYRNSFKCIIIGVTLLAAIGCRPQIVPSSGAITANTAQDPTPTTTPRATALRLLQVLHAPGKGYDNSALAIAGVTADPIDNEIVDMADGWTVRVSGDGKNVYYTDDSSCAIIVFKRDATTGFLTHLQTISPSAWPFADFPAFFLPTDLEFEPTGKYGYLLDWNSPGGVYVFERTTDNSADHGKLNLIQVVTKENIANIYLEYDPDSTTWVTTLNASLGGVAVIPSPDGKQLYAATYSASRALIHFDIIQEGVNRGKLTPAGFFQNGYGSFHAETGNGAKGLMAPWDINISPDGRYLFTADESSHSTAVFERDTNNGRLTYKTVFVNDEIYNGITARLWGASSVTVSPDSQYVLVGAGNQRAITVFKIVGGGAVLELLGGFADPTVTYAGYQSVDGLRGYPMESHFSPDGKTLYSCTEGYMAANWNNTALSVKQSFSASGTFNNEGATDTLVAGINDNAWNVDVSPDGRHVYFSSMSGAAIHVFEQLYE